MVERVPLPSLQDVPHLVLNTSLREWAEFSFRGTKGIMQQCDLGLCMALAFPRIEGKEDLNWAHKTSLLLASSEQTFDFGLQKNGAHWFLWRRHNVRVLSSDACYSALDELLSVMRSLYSRFVNVKPAQSSVYKASIQRFV